jgi:hypothetical protein
MEKKLSLLLAKLINKPTPPCISIYIPTHKKGNQTQQNRIQLKNQINVAEQQLAKLGFGNKKQDKLLEPVYKLLDDDVFWQHQQTALGLFISPNRFDYCKLPYDTDPYTATTNKFHLKPLLQLLGSNINYFVLRLDLGQSDLFVCNSFSIHKITPDQMPTSLDDTTRLEKSGESIQFHTGTQDTRGARDAQYHGQGTASESQKKAEIQKLFHQINNSILPVLNQTNYPLILAGLDYLQAIYRPLNRYHNLISPGLAKNISEDAPDSLHKQIKIIARQQFSDELKQAKNKYSLAKNQEKTLSNTQAIARAAFYGQIDTLFVNAQAQEWGFIRNYKHKGLKAYESDQKPGSQDLLNYAAIHTFQNQGKLLILAPAEIPDHSNICAILRFISD